MSSGYSAELPSIDGNSHLLNELAAALHAGRMDAENATQCRVPRAHEDVAGAVQDFASFAQDQYNDLVTLLTALSTKLRTTSHSYVRAEGGVQQELDRILRDGRYVAPENR